MGKYTACNNVDCHCYDSLVDGNCDKLDEWEVEICLDYKPEEKENTDKKGG